MSNNLEIRQIRVSNNGNRPLPCLFSMLYVTGIRQLAKNDRVFLA